MRSVMANELSLASAIHARRDSVGVQLLRAHGDEPARGPRVSRQVVARVVTAVARHLLVGLLVDEHLLHRAELRRAVPAPERLRETAQLATAAFLLVGRDGVAEGARRRARSRRE